MATSVILTGTTLGISVGPFNIYHTSEISGNLIASGVSRASLQSGWYTSQIYSTYIVRSTGACTNSITVLLTTPLPTVTPTATPTATPLVAYYTLTRCVDSATGFRTGNTTTSITLSTNDRVEDSGGLFYIVTGTTNSPLGSVGTVTDTGLTLCPAVPPTNYQPSVTTLSPNPITTTTSTFNGSITNVGNPNYTVKGFVWVLGTGTPTLSDNVENTVIPSGTGFGDYSSLVSGLTAGTQYTYRAYATNTEGTTYGSDNTFSTNVESYYSLKRCSDNVTGFRTLQTTNDISLSTSDRVLDVDLITYIVTGTTPTGTSVGTITTTGLISCPTSVRYYNMSLCSDPTLTFVGVNNSSENLSNGSSVSNGGVCYQVGTETTTSGLDTNITSWTRHFNCAACFTAFPTPTPTPGAVTPTPTPVGSCYEYDLESGGTGTSTYFNYTCCDGSVYTNVLVQDIDLSVCAQNNTVSVTSGPGSFTKYSLCYTEC